MPRTLRRNTRRRTRRVKRGGMNGRESTNASSPSMQRQRVNARQRMVGDNRSSRPTGSQDRTLRDLAELTAAPRGISRNESQITRMLNRRTPAEIDRDTRMNRELSMRPLLPTVARLQRQQEFIEELRSVAPPNKKGEFDRLITSCDRDRELLKSFIRENLSSEQGVMRMNQSHNDPLLNRNLPDIKVIGELKDIVNRCSRNRIELMNIIRDVYPQLSDILGASGLVQHGVARYLDYTHQPGYGFVDGALQGLNFVNDEVFDFSDESPRERVIDRMRRERKERLSQQMVEPESSGVLASRGVRPGSVLERLLEERRLRNTTPASVNPELLESGYLDNGIWINRSSPENTRYLPRMNYGSRSRRKSKSKGKRRRSIN